MLAEENASLILELDARPTVKQYKSLQRQMDILSRRLSESKAEAQGYALRCFYFALPTWPAVRQAQAGPTCAPFKSFSKGIMWNRNHSQRVSCGIQIILEGYHVESKSFSKGIMWNPNQFQRVSHAIQHAQPGCAAWSY